MEFHGKFHEFTERFSPGYVHSQSQNNRKFHVNFTYETHNQSMWQEVTSYLPCRFVSKAISKAVSAIVKTKVHTRILTKS
jgi:hypothetical protein